VILWTSKLISFFMPTYSDTLSECLDYLVLGEASGNEDDCVIIFATTSTIRGDVTGMAFSRGVIPLLQAQGGSTANYVNSRIDLYGGLIISLMVFSIVIKFFKK